MALRALSLNLWHYSILRSCNICSVNSISNQLGVDCLHVLFFLEGLGVNRDTLLHLGYEDIDCGSLITYHSHIPVCFTYSETDIPKAFVKKRLFWLPLDIRENAARLLRSRPMAIPSLVPATTPKDPKYLYGGTKPHY